MALREDTWRYDDRTIEDSDARRPLVIRFNHGRVSDLVLVVPAVAAELRKNPRPPLAFNHLAAL